MDPLRAVSKVTPVILHGVVSFRQTSSVVLVDRIRAWYPFDKLVAPAAGLRVDGSFLPDIRVRLRLEPRAMDTICASIVWMDRFREGATEVPSS